MTPKKRGDSPQDNQKEPVFKSIETHLIDTQGQSVRAAQDDDHVVELSMSLSKHGLLEPIVVLEKDDGRYQLEAGFHRLAAASRLNWKTIPAHIRPSSTGPTKAIALIENIVRRNMTLQEEVLAVNSLHTDENLSPSSICDLLGKSRDWVDKRLAIPNYPEDIKQELLDGNLTITKSEILAGLTDPGMRALVTNQVISSKLTAKQTHDLVEMYLAAPTISSAVEAGLQKKIEISEASKSYRQCDLCGRKREILEIKFIPVCIDPISCNETVVSEINKLQEAPDAT